MGKIKMRYLDRVVMPLLRGVHLQGVDAHHSSILLYY